MLTLLSLSLLATGCPAPTTPTPPKTVGSAATENARGLEAAPASIIEALTLAGLEPALAYTWKGGHLTGFVELDGAGRVDIGEVDEGVRSLLSVDVKDSKQPIDLDQARGLIVFAVRLAKSADQPRECVFGFRLFVDGDDSKNPDKKSSASQTITGTLPNFRTHATTANGTTFLITPSDGKQRTVFQLKHVPSKSNSKP